MEDVRNPFVPGAGSKPPQLAGRDNVIRDADIALRRVLAGRHDRSQILYGLRGTGKTVLLSHIEAAAADAGWITSFIEAPDDSSLPKLLGPELGKTLRKLSMTETAKASALQAFRALKSFVSSFRVELSGVSIAVDAEPGVADSGNIELDLTELFLIVGQAARDAHKGWAIFIDEVQYLDKTELGALIVALHRVSQRSLPILFFGAGLPQIGGMTGDIKSYSERLFRFPPIGPLDEEAAAHAIREPILAEGEAIKDEALEQLVGKTSGYPYFLQEWGYQAWNLADASPITLDHVQAASQNALRRLDQEFFRVRLDRLTPKEREYIIAMADLGDGPYRSADVAAKLDAVPQKLGPHRSKIISKGMIYSPAHGDIDFTVPMFADFVRRQRGAI